MNIYYVLEDMYVSLAERFDSPSSHYSFTAKKTELCDTMATLASVGASFGFPRSALVSRSVLYKLLVP